MRRKIEDDLNRWFESNSSLFIDGARQTGKTYIIEEFCKAHFENFVELNLLSSPKAIPLLIKDMDVDVFLSNLSLAVNQRLIPGKTLIFIDEIQEIENYKRDHNLTNTDFDLITLMKFLTIDGRYRFAISGSLLGVSLGDISSWPSGYMSSFTLFPMDFEEFCWANNLNPAFLEKARESLKNKIPLDQYVHDTLLDLFRKYILVGGMPKAVKTFVDTKGSWRDVELSQAEVEMYNTRDVSKYSKIEDKLAIKLMYDSIPEELSKKNKRFQVGMLKKKNKPQEINSTFLWLENAGVAIPVWNTSEPVCPLRASMDRNLCKLFHEDTGLLTYSMMDYDLKEKVLLGEKDINFGGIYENVVASLLHAHGFKNLYYYNSKKYGEVDFLIEKHGEVIPIEVKSGKDYARHQALDNLQSVYDIKESIVLHNGNIKVKDNVIYLPIYLVEFITKRGEF